MNDGVVIETDARSLDRTAEQLASGALQRLGGDAKPIVAAEQPSLLGALVSAARDPNTNIAVMERLFVMHKEIRAIDAEAAFNAALARAQGQMPPVFKDRTNTQTSSEYARLQAINRVAKPFYSAEGLALSFDETESPLSNMRRYLCLVTHEQGHKREYHIDLPADDVGIKGTANKTMVHALASSGSYAQRILTKRVFNIAEEDDDDDGNAAGAPVRIPMSDDHKATITAKAEEVSKTTLRTVLKSYKVETLDDIPDTEYESIIRRLDATLKARASKGGDE